MLLRLLKRITISLFAVLVDAWKACSDADVLLESPSAMAGVHIAEALGVHDGLSSLFII
jgi:hypothetical protein